MKPDLVSWIHQRSQTWNLKKRPHTLLVSWVAYWCEFSGGCNVEFSQQMVIYWQERLHAGGKAALSTTYWLFLLQPSELLLVEVACSAVQCSGYTWVEWRVGGGLERIWIDLCYSARGGEEGNLHALRIQGSMLPIIIITIVTIWRRTNEILMAIVIKRDGQFAFWCGGAVRGGQEIWIDQWWEIQAWDDHKYHIDVS